MSATSEASDAPSRMAALRSRSQPARLWNFFATRTPYLPCQGVRVLDPPHGGRDEQAKPIGGTSHHAHCHNAHGARLRTSMFHVEHYDGCAANVRSQVWQRMFTDVDSPSMYMPRAS